MQDFEPYSLALPFVEDIEAVHSSCKLRLILSHLPIELNVDKTENRRLEHHGTFSPSHSFTLWLSDNRFVKF